MLALTEIRTHRPLAAPGVTAAINATWKLACGIRGVNVRVEGASLPTGPCIVATNASHKYDPIFTRSWLQDLGRPSVTVSKGKNWHGRLLRSWCRHTGTLPLFSRGYIITVDARSVLGRRPTEVEYRALRDHVDRGRPIDNPRLQAILDRPRDMLGRRFDPTMQTYRDAVRALYFSAQQELLRQAGQVVSANGCIHMYPEGTVAATVGPGRIGLVQLAQALGLSVVPVGVSGARGVFDAKGLAAGLVVLRVGHPIVPAALADLPPDFVAFDPSWEARAKHTLKRATDEVMTALKALVDPKLRTAAGKNPDGSRGTYRFV